ncbi:TonB-dependent receptor [Asticcacaulis taihuensis]|uniref:TonB-dependent receptor n=1 Tax=Asticcacaulis taihuensis TaxID=260084 RepID=UPI003F7C7333
MKLKSYALITTALTGVMIAGGVYAQDTSAPAATADNDTAQEVIVVGVRKSLQKSLNVKRRASAHIDVITAEDVSKFPDVNVAESLSRLPGITVDRSGGGEGEKIAINGIDSRLINVSLNGNPLASAQAGANDTDNGRSFNFANLAPELIGNVEVYKTTEARLDEGGIGGTVIVNSRKPLSLPKNTFTVNYSYNYNERNKENDPRYSVFYSTKDDSGRFGMLFSYDYNKSVLGSGSISTAYQNVCNAAHWGGCEDDGSFSDASSLPTVTSGPALNSDMIVPEYIWLSSGLEQRERKTYQLALQFKPSDDLEFNLTGTRIQSDFSSYSQTFQTDLSVNWNETNAYDSFVKVGNNTVALYPTYMNAVTTTDAGVTGGSGAFAVRMDEYYKRSMLNTNTYNLQSRWTPGMWTIEANIGTTKATGGSDPEYYLSFYGNTTGSWSMTPDGATLNLDTSATDPTLFKTRTSGQQAGFVKTAVTTDQIDYAKFDFKREVEWGPVNEILFGYKYQKHTNVNKPHFFNTVFNLTGSMADFETYISDPTLVDGLGAGGDLQSYVAMTQAAVAAYSIANRSASNIVSGDYRDAGHFWNTSEKTDALYVQANFRSGKWHGDFGVRYAKTENRQTYRSTMDYYPWDEEMITLDKSYDDILPSFNAAYDLNDDMMIRFSAGKVMSRPTFADMSGQVEYSLDRYSTLADGHFGGTGGNPDLQPYRATNYSASYEWYFAPNSLFNVDLTYKDVESYIVKKNTFIDVTLPTSAVDYCTNTVNKLHDLGDARTAPCGNVESMMVYAPFNGSNAKIPGISVGYQGNLPWGFGIQANITYLDQQYGSYTDTYNQTTGRLPMPYLSRWSYTVSPYYEKGPIQARISYTYRSKYTTDVGSESSAPTYIDGWGQLDASASYNLNDRLSFNLAAQNILDDMQHPYTNGGLPLSWSKYGTRVTVGVTYKMQ